MKMTVVGTHGRKMLDFPAMRTYNNHFQYNMFNLQKIDFKPWVICRLLDDSK
jgi:hypothetical protein